MDCDAYVCPCVYMPTGVECVQYSTELTLRLASKELNANTAFTAVCVRDLLVND